MKRKDCRLPEYEEPVRSAAVHGGVQRAGRPAICSLQSAICNRLPALVVLALALGGCGFFPHMQVQPSVKPFARQMPPMPANTVPVSGGEVLPAMAQARTLPNPVPATREARAAGHVYYDYYCRHCHGDHGDARVPVGEAYLPPPTDLTTPRVQNASDGELYLKMVTGAGHEPVLQSTVPPQRRWYIVRYLRGIK